jgi:CBS domain containing-hemolysin-like protein
MEEILGEIDDEYDSETLKEVQITPSHYIFSGRLEVEYLNHKYGLQIPEGDYETLGGFIISNSDKIPAKGERLYLEGFEIVILSTDNGRINELELKATLF